MDARLVSFGRIEIDGQGYDHDVVVEDGRIRRRDKAPSKPLRTGSGHTPLSSAEAIPWAGRRLIVGTGAYGQLPVMAELYDEAERREIEIVAVPTTDACRLLRDAEPGDFVAILHVTC